MPPKVDFAPVERRPLGSERPLPTIDLRAGQPDDAREHDYGALHFGERFHRGLDRGQLLADGRVPTRSRDARIGIHERGLAIDARELAPDVAPHRV